LLPKQAFYQAELYAVLELVIGVEPTTFSLQMRRSTN
jgi:hypothetical protein